MASELSSAYMLLLPLLVVPLLYLAVSARRGRGSGPRLPPAPWALPVIGHLHHLAMGGKLPHRTLRELARRHGPLMLLRFCELSVVVVSSPDAAREAMRTHDVAFASRPIGPTMRLFYQGAEGVIFAPYGDGWRQLRKICTLELLSHRRVHAFRPIREDELGHLLRSVAEASASSSPVDLNERIAAFVADSTVRSIVGSRSEDRDNFLRLLEEGLKIMPGMNLPDLFPSSRLAMLLSRVPAKIERRRHGMIAIADTIIKEHQESRAAAADAGVEEDKDLLDVLLRLQKDMDSQYPLTTPNIQSILIDMFGAGSETSATTLQWAMAELMHNPAVMRRAQGEVRRELAGHDKVTEDGLPSLHYLRLVIKETLRLHPPGPLLLRECRSACQVLGYDVTEGTMLLVNAWAIGRDPEIWDAAEEFSPERFERSTRDFQGTDFEFIPFGAGRRICPGMAFGLAHIELTLAALLFHFDWELPGGMAADEMDMTEAAGITTRRRSDLLLLAATRVPVPVQ